MSTYEGNFVNGVRSLLRWILYQRNSLLEITNHPISQHPRNAVEKNQPQHLSGEELPLPIILEMPNDYTLDRTKSTRGSRTTVATSVA